MTDPAPLAADLTTTNEDAPRTLDWRRVGGAGPLAPCRLCGRPAITRDPDGKPCHKTCAEQHEYDRWATRTAHHHRTDRLAA